LIKEINGIFFSLNVIVANDGKLLDTHPFPFSMQLRLQNIMAIPFFKKKKKQKNPIWSLATEV